MKNSRFRYAVVALCLSAFSAVAVAQNTNAVGGRPQGMVPPQGGMMPMGMGPMMGMGGINQFDVKFATEVPEEKDVVVKAKSDSLYSYFVENVKFGKSAKIVFSGDGAEVAGLPEGVLVEKDGAYLTIKSESVKPLAIELSGKTENGSLTVDAMAPVKLTFNNVIIKSQRGEAVLSQGSEHVYAVLAEGSVNELSDCRNPDMFAGPPPMGPMGGGMPNFSGGMPDFGGEMPDFSNMPMPPFMNNDREESPDDYHVQYGIRMKKPKMKEKVKLDGTFACNGSLTISGKGELKVQSNNKVGIKSKASIMFRPGNMVTVNCQEGKGVNSKNEIYMYGGVLNVNCSFSGDKALTSGRNMYFKGGHVVIKAGGGEASEGIQSKFLMQFDGGKVEVAAQDDAINSQGDLVINGGEVRAFSATNDAFDSNCNLVINGGKVFASGYGMPEGGLDCADESGYRLFINGGEVVAIGGRHSAPEKQSRQPSVQWRLDKLEDGKTYGIDGVSSYKSVRAYQMGGATLLFSSPKLKEGKSYTLSIDGEKKEQIESLKSPTENVGNMRMGFPF